MRMPASPMKFWDLVKKSGLSTDQYLKAIATQEEYENSVAVERRSSPESKAAITSYLGTLNGDLSHEISRKTICEKANVPYNQGNATFAKSEVKRLLLLRDQR